MRRKTKSIIKRFLTLLGFNKAPLHNAIGYVSPFEFEKRYYDNLTLSGIAV
ncbi:mobile element protein [Psychrobacter sp. JCM 18901]|nr:mobile element protein [Psychrobacter sp. JCM 18901]